MIPIIINKKIQVSTNKQVLQVYESIRNNTYKISEYNIIINFHIINPNTNKVLTCYTYYRVPIKQYKKLKEKLKQ